jgi:hypothetical protein
MAFRTKFPTTSDLTGTMAETAKGMSRRQRRGILQAVLSKFFAGSDQACFITTSSVTQDDIKTELQNRINVCIMYTAFIFIQI